MVKGSQQTQKSNVKYVGLTKVEVRAVNPTRAQLNKLLGQEDKDDDKEIEYTSTDQEGNQRVRIVFWLYDLALNKYFPHSFNLTDKVRLNKDETKTQFVNATCNTGWADTEDNLQDWFVNFQNKEKENLAPKKVRPALLGEEELVTFLRAWLGRMNWNNTDAEVLIDTKALLNEDFTELRSLIDSDFDAQFVVLLGVRTDEEDEEKQYQQVFGKSFLPGSMWKNIKAGFKLNTYEQKIWKKFEAEVSGEYGFKAFFGEDDNIDVITEYDKSKDLARLEGSKAPEATPTNAKY